MKSKKSNSTFATSSVGADKYKMIECPVRHSEKIKLNEIVICRHGYCSVLQDCPKKIFFSGL